MKRIKDFPLNKALLLCAIVSIPLILFSYFTITAVESSIFPFSDTSYFSAYVLVKSVIVGLSNSLIYTLLFIYLRNSFSKNIWISDLTYGFILWLIRYGIISISSLIDYFREIIIPNISFQSIFSPISYKTPNLNDIFLLSFFPGLIFLLIGITISFLYNKFKK